MNKEKELLDAGLRSLDHCKLGLEAADWDQSTNIHGFQINPSFQNGVIVLDRVYSLLCDGRRHS